MRLSDIPKKVMLLLGAFWLLLIVAGFAYYRSVAFFPFLIGVSLGTALNALKVVILDHTVKKAVAMENKDAANLIRVSHFARLLLTGLVLVLAAIVPFISIWGAAIGILTLQIAMYFVKHFMNQEEHETKSTDASQAGGD